ncbi:hypothetical protein ABVT39_006716 [Epinephelus coioides]
MSVTRAVYRERRRRIEGGLTERKKKKKKKKKKSFFLSREEEEEDKKEEEETGDVTGETEREDRCALLIQITTRAVGTAPRLSA